MKRLFPILATALCILLLILQIASVVAIYVLNTSAKTLAATFAQLPEGGYALTVDHALWLDYFLSYWWIWGSAALCALLCVALLITRILRRGKPGYLPTLLPLPLVAGQGVLAAAFSFACPDAPSFQTSFSMFVWEIADLFSYKGSAISVLDAGRAIAAALPWVYAMGALLSLLLLACEAVHLIFSKRTDKHEDAKKAT